MPVWSDIQQYARDNYNLSRDEDEVFGLVFGFDDDRSQYIEISTFESMEDQWIEFRSAVCDVGDMDSLEALRRNNDLVIGALSADDDRLYLVHNAPISTLDIDDFERPLHVLAVCADRLEAEFSSSDDY